MNKKITVFGAGISGLVAAINLGRAGFEVTVIDKRDNIGGSTKWHPSVHQQNFNLDATSKYINVDLSKCFQPVKKHTFYFYGRKINVEDPGNSYVCEKGSRATSIENYLYQEAKKNRVEFNFGEDFDLKKISYSRDSVIKPCIVATGLEIDAYRLLNIKHSLVQGFRAVEQSSDGDDGRAVSFFGNYTNHDFAYVASYGDLIFSLLFSRKGMSREYIDIYKKHLLKSEGISFKEWEFSSGCIPLEVNLVKNGLVFAGTISGMMDPFFLNGISGALISGKLAAEVFINRKHAYMEFNRFTKNFRIRRLMKLSSTKLPFKILSFPVIVRLSNFFQWVGVL
ncbi:MAG: NAD(P)-binding protein [Desulfatiglans sp.]|jgi:flavin-dependent dehydrogenase|nr:NAD(P)-binding protein [Desulfatiglans sp.]